MTQEGYKIAVPIFQGRVAPRLDTADNILFTTIEDGKVKGEEEVRVIGIHPMKMAHWFKEEGVTVLICCGIDRFCYQFMFDSNILIFPRIVGDVNKAVNAYLNGNLEGMAISCAHYGRGRNRSLRGGFRGGGRGGPGF